MNAIRSFGRLTAVMILSAAGFGGCYTQFAATDEAPDSIVQDPIIIVVPIPIPSPGPILIPGPNEPVGPPTAGKVPTGSKPAQEVTPKREIGHVRTDAGGPGQTNPDRPQVGKRGAR